MRCVKFVPQFKENPYANYLQYPKFIQNHSVTVVAGFAVMNGNQRPLPPFLTQGSDTEPAKVEESLKPLKLVSVDPVYLKFQLTDVLSSKVNLHIGNTTQKRVAWRLRSNAPTRYVVNPACGFLTSGESISIAIELANTNKFSDRHKFIVQAMEAKDDEKDRRRIWDSERAQSLDNLQCIRVYAVAASGYSKISNPTETSGVSTTGRTHTNTESSTSNSGQSCWSSGTTTSNSNALNSGLSNTDTSITSSAVTSTGGPSNQSGSSLHNLSTSSVSSNISTCSEMNVTDKIAALTSDAKGYLDTKSKASRRMVEVVNEVKKVEVELDRVGVQCKQLNAQVNTITAQIAALVERSLELDQQIKVLTSKN
ncbi:unnamed protein product [Bursaphelenchus xylophilus]|uniref:Major sperm protein n=1 Tax=Bursaphelenchus xylophilus TaxID=6326 RepID=A0A1I7SD80_BURXY|nr:unnamed protein product [Bursaphelenchus xylophilus]CAG9130532.1 unnamed protein product [Bursaphelenchus xylophilus]